MKMSKETLSKTAKNPYFITGTAAVVVVALAAGFGYYRQTSEPVATPTPTVTPLVTESPTPTPTASPAASPEVSPTPTPSNAPQNLPDSAQKTVSSFYASYKAKDIAKVGESFTPDTTNELKSLHSRLFTGRDTDGVPGGPTLFSSNSASQSVGSYSISSSEEDGSNWTVTVTEQRISGTGESAGSVSTVLKLTPAGDSWQIDQYYHAGLSGKYDGFLIQ